MTTTPRLKVKSITFGDKRSNRYELAKEFNNLDTFDGFRGVIARKVVIEIQDTKPRSPFESRMKQVVRNRRRKISQVMSSYYAGMFEEVGNILASPPMPAAVVPAKPLRASYPRTLRLVGADGTSRTDTVNLETGRSTYRAWNPLSANYAHSAPGTRWEGLPVSKVFWKKTGELSATYQTKIRGLLPLLRDPERYAAGDVKRTDSAERRKTYAVKRNNFGQMANVVDSVKLVKLNAKNGRFYTTSAKTILSKWTFSIKYPKTNEPILDAIFRRSYTSRDPVTAEARIAIQTRVRYYMRRKTEFVRSHEATRYTLDHPAEGLERMVMAEYTRPMFARFAVAVAKKETDAVRKMLKRK